MEPIRVTGDLAAVGAVLAQAGELAATLPAPEEEQRFAGVPALLAELPGRVRFSLVTYPPDPEGRPRLLAVIRIPRGHLLQADYQTATIVTPEFLLGTDNPVGILLEEARQSWESAITSAARY